MSWNAERKVLKFFVHFTCRRPGTSFFDPLSPFVDISLWCLHEQKLEMEKRSNNADLITICMNRNYAFELHKDGFFHTASKQVFLRIVENVP